MEVPLYRWMIYFMENTNPQMDDDSGYPHNLGNLHIVWYTLREIDIAIENGPLMVHLPINMGDFRKPPY